MAVWTFLGIALAVLIAAGLAWWLLLRPVGRVRPEEEATRNLGYGRARWEREVALWEGTLRRLETQAARHTDLPPHLAREIERAGARLARARAALAGDDDQSRPQSGS